MYIYIYTDLYAYVKYMCVCKRIFVNVYGCTNVQACMYISM